MRAIAPLNIDSREVYEICIKSIDDVDLRARLEKLSDFILYTAHDYHAKACSEQLFTIQSNSLGNDERVHGEVTKRELKLVYSTHMVAKGKPARKIYDQILSLAPIGRCPFCGLGYASTLDHYLPKNSYPQLSVTPENLVPSCKDCNTGKGSGLPLSAGEQCLHPYFDHKAFISEQWLFARVATTTPLSVTYYVNPPQLWSEISKERVIYHFSSFGLARRYSIEAANEIASRQHHFDEIVEKYGSSILVEMLEGEALSHSKLHVNSWQTALYQALYFENKQQLESKNDIAQYSDKTTCQRCRGKGQLFNSCCEACNGLGYASKTTLESLGTYLFSPVTCPDCVAGNIDCPRCKGEGKIPWENAR